MSGLVAIKRPYGLFALWYCAGPLPASYQWYNLERKPPSNKPRNCCSFGVLIFFDMIIAKMQGKTCNANVDIITA